LPDAHRRRRELLDVHADRPRELVTDLGAQRFGDGENQAFALDVERNRPVLNGHIRRDQCTHHVVGQRQLAMRRRSKVHRLGEQRCENGFVYPGDFEQVRDEVSAIDHLASERLLDLAHGRDVALDDQ
jgi:hypothetical protein